MNPEIDWHARFTQQATWTEPLRRYLFNQNKISQPRNILEVGCGTGAVLYDFTCFDSISIHAVDLSRTRLIQAHTHVPTANLLQADGHSLPYLTGCFSITCCHFLLLWVNHPVQVLHEMKRVTHPGGAILVLAEPDYTQRIDRSPLMARLGTLQTQTLRQQGVDPGIGSHLPDLFAQAGIQLIESGALQPSTQTVSAEQWHLEWQVLSSDLAGTLPQARLEFFRKQAWQEFLSGVSGTFIPTYYAWGQA